MRTQVRGRGLPLRRGAGNRGARRRKGSGRDGEPTEIAASLSPILGCNGHRGDLSPALSKATPAGNVIAAARIALRHLPRLPARGFPGGPALPLAMALVRA